MIGCYDCRQLTSGHCPRHPFEIPFSIQNNQEFPEGKENMTIQEEIKQAKKLFVEKNDVRAMNLNGEPYIMGKWSELEAYLTSALQRMQGNVGQNKRIAYQLGLKERQIAYQLGFKEGQDETAEKICIIIDKIESQSGTTLEEWKQYKHIRNAIRDKFILREKINE